MDAVAEKLLNYLHEVIYSPSKAFLDVKKLPEEFRDFGSALQNFSECVLETKSLAQALSKGDLTAKLPSCGNEIATPLKSLHALLRHLTWQAQQIAQGDYKQRVEFMGDFSDAFNKMVEQLTERQRALEEKIDQIQKNAISLEQSNLLFLSLIHYIPQQIIVIDKNTREILFMNNIAVNEANNDAGYIEHIMEIISEYKDLDYGCEIEIKYTQREIERYFMAKVYSLVWNDSNVEIYAISDVSATKNKIDELEVQAYRDCATQLYNRTFGMLTLDSWLQEKRRFVLVFADLDNLKYINDEFGHNEGDKYIINAAKHLRTFSPDAVICRTGGDEFMLLASNIGYEGAYTKMSMIYNNFKKDGYLANKAYSYSISFGIAAIETDNILPASSILSIADDRMYENKRMNKKARAKTPQPEIR